MNPNDSDSETITWLSYATTAYTQAKEIVQKIVKEFISRNLSFQDKLLEKL